MRQTAADAAGSPAVMIAAPDFFAALANDTRLRSLMLLTRHAELCVCELTHAVGLSQPHVSRHLAQLREACLLPDRRQGVWVCFRINGELPAWALHVLEQTAHGVTSVMPFRDDAAALAEMPERPGTARCA
jgi:ArsR family transcriptional regulator, arsenate/arsenite/antimonite-responsive transcriptional repressor